MPRRSRTVKRSSRGKGLEIQVMLSPIPAATVPDSSRPDGIAPTGIVPRTAEECGRSAAQQGPGRWSQVAKDWSSDPYENACGAFATEGAKASKKTGKKCHLWRSTGLISRVARLTIREGEDYIHSLGRAAAGRDGASAKPLTVHTVTDHSAIQSWPCSRRRVGCAGFGAPASAGVFLNERRSRKVPGCLTSESEERETWTAESLRTAFANGGGLAGK